MRNYKVEKDFIVDGFRCVIIGQSLGHRCGYVHIPADHKFYGEDYDDIYVKVHGGLTYSGFNDINYPVDGSNKEYWIGFDCAHLGDGKDFESIEELSDEETYNYMLKLEEMFKIGQYEEVRTTEYVEKELINLVKQLKEV